MCISALHNSYCVCMQPHVCTSVFMFGLFIYLLVKFEIFYTIIFGCFCALMDVLLLPSFIYPVKFYKHGFINISPVKTTIFLLYHNCICSVPPLLPLSHPFISFVPLFSPPFHHPFLFLPPFSVLPWMNCLS